MATDSEAIAAAVEKAGGRAIMTRADHVSGSDRIYEALEALDPERRIGIVVNVQGDLPTIEPADIRAALGPLADPAVDIATLAAVITDPAERTNPNVVKVVGTPVAPGRLRATTFTRADATGPGPHYHHIGLYAYRRAALERFVKLPPSANEQREKLEQLRALDAGMRIDVAIVDKRAARRRYAGGAGQGAQTARRLTQDLKVCVRIAIKAVSWPRKRSFSRANRGRIRISPAAKPIRTTSRCPARPSRTASPRSPAATSISA